MQQHDALPGYTQADVKRQLVEKGCSGTIYALVMPESERALMRVVDGGDRLAMLRADDPAAYLDIARRREWLSRFHEPWTQKQDAMHVEYFDAWFDWAAPVVTVDRDAFAFRYPTAGASQGIFQIMAEYATGLWSTGRTPTIHVFEGEYEGFSEQAKALSMRVVRHRRDDWESALGSIDRDGQFWLSQPSSIDGGVWPGFDKFMGTMAAMRPDVQVIPDLSYVGAVSARYEIALDYANVPAFVISHSKPFGGYYHRCGGVVARSERPSLFGNKWFKNLTSLAWGVQMMRSHDVFELPSRYRRVQREVAAEVGARLGIEGLVPSDISMLATAPVPADPSPLVSTLIRGVGADRRLRVCLTPGMTVKIDPDMAPGLARLIMGDDA